MKQILPEGIIASSVTPFRRTDGFSWSESSRALTGSSTKVRIDQLIRAIHEAPKANGSERIYLPGEKEWANRDTA